MGNNLIPNRRGGMNIASYLSGEPQVPYENKTQIDANGVILAYNQLMQQQQQRQLQAEERALTVEQELMGTAYEETLKPTFSQPFGYRVSQEAYSILKAALPGKLTEFSSGELDLEDRLLASQIFRGNLKVAQNCEGEHCVLAYSQNPEDCCELPYSFVSYSGPLPSDEVTFSDITKRSDVTKLENYLTGIPTHDEQIRATGETESLVNLSPD